MQYAYTKTVIAVILISLVIMAFLLTCRRDEMSIIENRLKGFDYFKIRDACRLVITKKDLYKPETPEPFPVPGLIVLMPKNNIQWDRLPLIIKKLKPLEIMITENSLCMYLDTLPSVLVVAYAEGAKQSGTIKLIDCLWYWNRETKLNTLTPPPAAIPITYSPSPTKS